MACKIQLNGVFKPDEEDILSFVRSIKSAEFESIQKQIEEREEYKTFIQDVFKQVTDIKQKLKDVVSYLDLKPGTYSFWLTLDDKEIEFIASVDAAGKVDITYTKEFTIENAAKEQERREKERIKKERISAEIGKWVRAQEDTRDEKDASLKQTIIETIYFSGWEEFTAKTMALVARPDVENAKYLLKKIFGSEEEIKSQFGSEEMISVLANEIVEVLKKKKTRSDISAANLVAGFARQVAGYYIPNKNRIEELIRKINTLTLKEEATLVNIEYEKPFDTELKKDEELLDELHNILTNVLRMGRMSSEKILPTNVSKTAKSGVNARFKEFYNKFILKPWQIKPNFLNDFFDRFGYLINYPTDNYNEFLRFFFKVEKTRKDQGRKLTNDEIRDIYISIKKEGSTLFEEDTIKPGDMALIIQAISLQIMDSMYKRLTSNVDTSLPEIKELIEEYLAEREFLRNLIGDKLNNLQQNVIDFISNISSNISYASEISAENRSDKHYIQEQPFDSERVRIILASLRRTYEKYISERPDPGLYETTIFGEKMANVSDIFVKLMNVLSKTHNINSYLDTFTQLARMYGEIGQLYYKLSFDKGLSDFNFVEWQNFIQFYNTFTRSEVPPAVLIYKVEGYPVLMIGDEYFALQETTKRYLQQIYRSGAFAYTGNGYMLSKRSVGAIENYLKKEDWDKEQASLFLAELGIKSKFLSNRAPYVSRKDLGEFIKASRELAKVLVENQKELVKSFDIRKAWFAPYLNNLAQYEVIANPETKHVYKDIEGKFRYLFRNPSYHTKLIRVLANVRNKEELLEQYPDFDSDYIKHSAFLNSLFDKDGNVIEENRPMAVFLLGSSNAYATGSNIEDFSYSDFLVGVTNGLLHDLVSLGILGDSNTQSMVKLPINDRKIDMIGYLADEVYAAIVDRIGLPKDQVGKLGLFEEILNKNSTVYKDIYKFIQEERKKLPKLTRFDKPESEFTEEERKQQRIEEEYYYEYYATLPTRIYNELKSMEVKIISQINDRIIELANKEKKELIKAGIFKLQETGKYTIEKLDRERIAKVFGIKEAIITEKDLDRIVTWLSKKHLVYTFELHKLFFGDPRVFNKKSISDNLLITTLSKRSKMFATPAEQMFDNRDFNEKMNLLLNNGVGINNEYAWRTDLPKDDPTRIDFTSTFTDALIEEPIANTKDIVDSSLPDEIKQAYSEIKEADSFVWISDKFYIQSVIRSGRATEEDLRFFEWQMAATRLALEEDGYYTYADEAQKQRDLEIVSEEEPEGYLDPKKPILVSSNNGIVKIDKSAQYALFYPMIRKFPNLRRLYVLMMRNGVDYLATQGARKAGGDVVNRVYKPDGTVDENTILKKTWSSWNDYGIVQRKEYKEDLQHLAIQLAKVVTLNLYKDGVPVSKELDLAYKELVDAIGDLSSKTLTSLKKILGISDDGTVDYNKMAEGLYSIMYKAGLTPEELDRIRKFGELHRVYPLETLSDFGTLVNSIYKYLDKSIIHSSLNGRTLVQIPSTFFEKGNRKIFVKRDGKYIEATKAGEIKEDEKIIIGDDNLKFITKTVDGKTTVRSMEVLVSRKLFEEYIPEGLSDEEAYKYINESTDPNLKRVLRGIAWRIPTQGPNFVINIKVAGFLDKRMGNIIVVPSGIVTLNNSDFDIDTLNTVFYSNKKPLNTKSTADLEKLIYLTKNYIDTAINSRRAGAGILQNVSEKSRVPLIFTIKGIEKTIYRDLRRKDVSQAQIEDLRRIVRFFGGFESFASQLIKDKGLVISRIKTEMLPQIELTVSGNKLVSAIERLLSAIPDEEYFRKADDYGLLEQANKIEKKYENTDLNYFPKDFTTLSYSDVTFLRNVYMWLKNSIGIGALGVTGHAMSQKDSIYIDTNSEFVKNITEGQGVPLLPFKYNQNAAGYPSFSQVYDVDGNRISEILSGLTTLIVDSVNDPSIGKIYPHKRILSVAAMLYRLGVGKATAAFLNQPIIRKMAKELIELKEWRKNLVELIYEKAYRELKEGVNVDSRQIEKLLNKKYTYDELMQMIDYYSKLKEKPSTDFLLNQELIGRVFVNLIALSNKFYKVTKAFSIDSNNFNSPFFYKYVDEVIREVEEEGIFKNVRQALEKTHVYKQLAVMKKTEDSLKHVFVTERPEVKEMFYRALKHMFEDEYVSADQVNMAYVKMADMFIKYLILHRRPEFKYMLRNLFVGGGRIENKLNTLRSLYNTDEILPGVEPVYYDESSRFVSVGFTGEKATFLDRVTTTFEFRRFKEFLNKVPDQFKNLYRELVYLSFVQPSIDGKNIGKYIPLEDRLEIIGDTLSGLLTNGPTQEEIELFEKEFFPRNIWWDPLLKNEKNIPYFSVDRGAQYSSVETPAKRKELGTKVLFLRRDYNYPPYDFIYVNRLNEFWGRVYDIENDIPVTKDLINRMSQLEKDAVYVYKLLKDEFGRPVLVESTKKGKYDYVYYRINPLGINGVYEPGGLSNESVLGILPKLGIEPTPREIIELLRNWNKPKPKNTFTPTGIISKEEIERTKQAIRESLTDSEENALIRTVAWVDTNTKNPIMMIDTIPNVKNNNLLISLANELAKNAPQNVAIISNSSSFLNSINDFIEEGVWKGYKALIREKNFSPNVIIYYGSTAYAVSDTVLEDLYRYVRSNPGKKLIVISPFVGVRDRIEDTGSAIEKITINKADPYITQREEQMLAFLAKLEYTGEIQYMDESGNIISLKDRPRLPSELSVWEKIVVLKDREAFLKNYIENISKYESMTMAITNTDKRVFELNNYIRNSIFGDSKQPINIGERIISIMPETKGEIIKTIGSSDNFATYEVDMVPEERQNRKYEGTLYIQKRTNTINLKTGDQQQTRIILFVPKNKNSAIPTWEEVKKMVGDVFEKSPVYSGARRLTAEEYLVPKDERIKVLYGTYGYAATPYMFDPGTLDNVYIDTGIRYLKETEESTFVSTKFYYNSLLLAKPGNNKKIYLVSKLSDGDTIRREQLIETIKRNHIDNNIPTNDGNRLNCKL